MDKRHHLLIVTAALAASIALPAARAAVPSEADYISRFNGSWGGTGTVVNDTKPWMVNCQATGLPGADVLAIRATCRVLLVISVPINVDVTYDAQTNSYRGTYSAGDLTAAISGKRSGDTVAFAMTWDRPIDKAGNATGRLTIVNTGNGNFQLLIDNFKANAPTERTTDVLLTQN